MQVVGESDGINALLAAEREAKRTVDQARRARAECLKRAKEEALEAIAAEKKHIDQDIRAYITEHQGAAAAQDAAIAKQTQARCREMDIHVQRNKDRIVNMLLSNVLNILPELHVNAK